MTASLHDLLAGQPDLSRGRCMPWRSSLRPQVWVGGGNAEETHAAVQQCKACVCLSDCHTWLTGLEPWQRPMGIVAGRLVRFRPGYRDPEEDDRRCQGCGTVFTAEDAQQRRYCSESCRRKMANARRVDVRVRARTIRIEMGSTGTRWFAVAVSGVLAAAAAPAPVVQVTVCAGLAASTGLAGDPGLRLRTAEEIERKRESNRRYNLTHKQQISRQKAGYYLEHADEINERCRAARSADPEHYRAAERAYRKARKLAAREWQPAAGQSYARILAASRTATVTSLTRSVATIGL